jgi:regulator of sigma D
MDQPAERDEIQDIKNYLQEIVDYFSQSFFDKYCMEEKKTEGCYRVMN